jgi:hypothetical protein
LERVRTREVREDLGKVGPVIAEQVEEAMLGHRRTLDTTRATSSEMTVRDDFALCSRERPRTQHRKRCWVLATCEVLELVGVPRNWLCFGKTRFLLLASLQKYPSETITGVGWHGV